MKKLNFEKMEDVKGGRAATWQAACNIGVACLVTAAVGAACLTGVGAIFAGIAGSFIGSEALC
ncbi:hypothetical protein [Bacteroides sp. 51]|uniref:hypothetical protein n=1 Tax=Bacteroides sp. 51 TaxID=2302938 RepID=UPI0013D099BA|nr:hypothetical protein [Bacteroides sp. 51]